MTALDLSEIRSAKETIVAVARRAFERGLQTNTGGNLSIRLKGTDAIVVKASGVGFAECAIDNLVVVDQNGMLIDGSRKPSQDTLIHLAIYRERQDVNGIVHVHSPWATGWACARRELPSLTFQAKEKIGRAPLIPTAPNGVQQTPTEVILTLGARDIFAALLEDHGVLGLGQTLLQALHAVELVEETAHVAAIRLLVMSSPSTA
jgi:L-fuculose-phosphate aldolase/L-ribulose-5-phosphate 4-epimerase